MKARFLWPLLAGLVLTACSSNEIMRGPLDISIGQQLIDLKNAYASGAMNSQEYEQQRKLLIRNVQ